MRLQNSDNTAIVIDEEIRKDLRGRSAGRVQCGEHLKLSLDSLQTQPSAGLTHHLHVYGVAPFYVANEYP